MRADELYVGQALITLDGSEVAFVVKANELPFVMTWSDGPAPITRGFGMRDYRAASGTDLLEWAAEQPNAFRVLIERSLQYATDSASRK